MCANGSRIYKSIHYNNDDLGGSGWDGVKVGIFVDLDNHKLCAVHNDKILKEYEIDIPSNTSYYLYFWLQKQNDKVSVYPPIQHSIQSPN